MVEQRGLFLFGWRQVPIAIKLLGEKAASTLPRIEQVLIGRPSGLSDDEYERRLFLCRNEIEKRAAADNIRHFYIPSFSSQVINYKGLLLSPSLQRFYRDLENPAYETSLAVYHQRYSTNTFPTWPLSQPFRMLAHNGEINTRRGNANWMRAREAELSSGEWKDDVDLLKPIIQPGGSDSAELDNALEALVMSGRSVLHAMTMLVPPAWRERHRRVAGAAELLRVSPLLQRAVGRPRRASSSPTASRSAPASTATASAPRATRSPTTASSRSARKSAPSSSRRSASSRKAGSLPAR